MSKKSIIIVLLIMLSIGIISLYTTFAYDEENTKLEESNADYNLIYSIKEKSNKQVTVGPKEEKYIDITLNNVYKSTVRYGMYYYLVSPQKLPENVKITLAEDSQDLLENIIKPKQTRSISIKVTNNSEYSVDLLIGALVGFENGKIEDLVKNGEVLIK